MNLYEIACLAKSDAAVLSPFACGEIDDGNSVVHCCPRSSFIPDGAALNTEAMAYLRSILG